MLGDWQGMPCDWQGMLGDWQGMLCDWQGMLCDWQGMLSTNRHSLPQHKTPLATCSIPHLLELLACTYCLCAHLC